MNHEEIVGRLPWYLAGTLVPEEEDEVRAHLDECVACRREVETTRFVARVQAGEHPTSDELVDAAWERLDPADLAAVRNHLEDCPECREEMAMLRSARAAEGTSETSRRDPWRAWALAASVAAVLAGGALLREVLRPEAPGTGVTVVELLPESFAVRGTDHEGAIPEDRTGPLALILVTDRTEAFEEVRLVVRDGRGRELWRASGLSRSPSGDFAVLLPADLPGEGRLVLTLEGRLGDGWTTIEVYGLTPGT